MFSGILTLNPFVGVSFALTEATTRESEITVRSVFSSFVSFCGALKLYQESQEVLG
jgi:hypothetical protein